VLGAASATTLSAHDFWLVPDAFTLADGGTVSVRGQTSSRFPTSESAVDVERVADARMIGAATAQRITDLSRDGTSLRLRHRPYAPGQYVVAVTLHPRSVRESAAGFRRYLELEGAPEALARVEREGLLRGRDSVTRRYAKYAKTVVAVGRGGDRAFDRTAGHPLEFVPLTDPAAVRAGDTLALRLLYRGRPVAAARVHAGVVDWPLAAGATGRGAAGASAAAPADIHLTSDGSGVVRVPVARPGLWNVRTIHVVQADAGSGADWDTHWASTVFNAGPGQARRPATTGASGGEVEASLRPVSSSLSTPSTLQPGDSAAVAGTVARFHEALAAGDSAGVLALLAPDAVILESGGVETREEYRGHHLPGDIGFARAVKSVRSPIRVTLRGDVAWATSTSVTQGEYRGRAVNSAGAELMVLTRAAAAGTSPAGWRITAVHWSSRARRTSSP
jgi:ketosteroid isomerase-like protein